MALMALGRPGPLASGGTDLYIRRKNGEVKVEYLHPRLAELTRSTYGILLYQETCMRAAGVLAGYTPGEQDKLRKVIGKKLASELPAQHEKFVSGCLEERPDERRGHGDLEQHRDLRVVRVQRRALGRLRSALLPDGLPQGQLHPEYLCALC